MLSRPGPPTSVRSACMWSESTPNWPEFEHRGIFKFECTFWPSGQSKLFSGHKAKQHGLVPSEASSRHLWEPADGEDHSFIHIIHPICTMTGGAIIKYIIHNKMVMSMALKQTGAWMLAIHVIIICVSD